MPWGRARLHPRDRLRRRLFWLVALLLLGLTYFAMAPDAPNLPKSPEQAEPVGRTAY